MIILRCANLRYVILLVKNVNIVFEQLQKWKNVNAAHTHNDLNHRC